MRKRWGIWVLFVLGFLCCCLPLLAHLYSQKEQEKVIATYQKTIQEQKLDVKELRKQAEHYNSILYQTNGATLSGEDALLLGDASYASLLDTTGTGVMGSLDIPKIGVELPIYHGTSEEVLSKGIGHLQGSSLPVGGESTHSILTGHRGLPQSKLLTRLDEMEKGDYFFFHVLNETLAYQVTEIQVVKPGRSLCIKDPGRAGSGIDHYLYSLRVKHTPPDRNWKAGALLGKKSKQHGRRTAFCKGIGVYPVAVCVLIIIPPVYLERKETENT